MPSQKLIYINLGLEAELIQLIDSYASEEKLSRSGALRDLIVDSLVMLGRVPLGSPDVTRLKPGSGWKPYVKAGKLLGWVADL